MANQFTNAAKKPRQVMAEFNWIPPETFGASGFQTEWLTVNQAQQGGAGSLQALEKLCQTYWYPLYVYVRGQGHDHHAAQDLTQEFFSRLLARDWLRNVHPSKGRFRAFLLDAMNKFLTDEWRRAGTLKRGGGRAVFSLDALAAEQRFQHEPAHHESPDRLFDRSWAATVAEQALASLRQEYLARDQAGLFDALKHTLAGERSPAGQAEIARRLGFKPGTLRKSAQRLRERYQELLRTEIVQTVINPDELDDEIRHIREALSR